MRRKFHKCDESRQNITCVRHLHITRDHVLHLYTNADFWLIKSGMAGPCLYFRIFCIAAYELYKHKVNTCSWRFREYHISYKDFDRLYNMVIYKLLLKYCKQPFIYIYDHITCRIYLWRIHNISSFFLKEQWDNFINRRQSCI
jgi:hypothetical protein